MVSSSYYCGGAIRMWISPDSAIKKLDARENHLEIQRKGLNKY
jgi:hypothetical protein